MTEFFKCALPGVDASSRPHAHVAIVAVHGVGHHATGASADAMANLLSGLEGYSAPPGKPPFQAFVTNPIQFPLPGAMFFPSMRPQKTSEEGSRGVFEERRGFFTNKFSLKNWRSRRQEVCAADIADEFMLMQLGDYSGDAVENTLRTDRLEGHRAANATRAAADVHIYDMQWADAAGGDSSFVRFFMSFYQLLIHLTSLARISVDMAALEQYGKWDWFLMQRAHSYAARMFTLVILPALTLLMGVAFSTLPLLLGPGRVAMVVASSALFLGVLGLVLLLSQRSDPPLGSRGWWPWLFLAALASVAVSFFVFATFPTLVGLVLVLEWWVLGAAVLAWVFKKYDEVRRGAFLAGLTSIIISTLGFLACVWCQQSLEPVALRTASFWIIQYIFLALRISWVIFIGLMIVSLVFEWICRVRIRFAKSREVGELARARAALRTGRFAMALPAVLSLLLSVFVWSGVYHFIVPRVQLFERVVPAVAPVCCGLRGWVLDPRATESLFITLQVPGQEPVKNPYHFLEGLLVQSAPPGFTIVLGLMAIGFSLLILMVLPAVFFEFRTSFSAPNAPAKRLGSWVSSGFHYFRVMIWCFWLSAFGVSAIYAAALWLAVHFHFVQPAPTALETLYGSWDMKFSARLLSTSGALIAGSAALILGVLVKYMSSALDAILDVDTYLRTTPEDDVPRARIVERYAALLRYIHRYRGPDGQRYDRIVVVAHSLGSVISADILRFLARRVMPELTRFAFAEDDTTERPPIILFTMGNPLRQLLSRFFPHLYRWIRPVPDGGGELSTVRVAGTQIDPSVAPDPVQQLHVKQWINYFRSGDYVGRALWEDDWYIRTKSEADAFPKGPDIFTDAAKTRVEACIGLGAHTHYWDRTAPDVAVMLNELI